jgi:simple sugar transport system permease protein
VADSIGLWGIPIAVLGGAIRTSTPFIFVSVGECITERSGRINLGLEGTLIFGAMTGFAVSFHTGSFLGADSALHWMAPWIGVLAAGAAGALMGFVHAFLCNQKRVNDIAVGIALMLFGIGIAFYLGKNLIKEKAPQLQEIQFLWFAENPAIRAAANVNLLFICGCILAPLVQWGLRATRWGMIVRTVGESVDAARAMGYSVNGVRTIATMVGGALAGMGGSFLTLYYPGGWSEGLSQGQGLMAVALVIFARWKPLNCLWASLLFGGTQALAPALQAADIQWGRHLFLAAPYILTLVVMIITCSPKRAQIGAPAELGKIRTA